MRRFICETVDWTPYNYLLREWWSREGDCRDRVFTRKKGAESLIFNTVKYVRPRSAKRLGELLRQGKPCDFSREIRNNRWLCLT